MKEKTTSEEKTTSIVKTSEQSSGLTKREFLRKVIVGGAVIFVAGGGYVRPELETLQGPQVAHATGSHQYPPRSYKSKLQKGSKKFKFARNKMKVPNNRKKP